MLDPTSTPPPAAVAAYGIPRGPVGTVRPTPRVLALTVLTLGLYGLVWLHRSHEEMRAHTSRGPSGRNMVLLAIFLGCLVPFLTARQVGELYLARGACAPVGARTGLWWWPGVLLLVGPLVWLVKTNRALNDYWVAVGDTATLTR